MPSGRTNNFPEIGRGLGHAIATILGSTVGYPSDSLASCPSYLRIFVTVLTFGRAYAIQCCVCLSVCRRL